MDLNPRRQPSEWALVLGKFHPYHPGHRALIEEALRLRPRVLVLVAARPEEVIPGPQRFEWVYEAWRHEARVRVDYTDADLPDAPEPDPEVARVWGSWLRARYPDIGLFVAGEAYAPWVAQAWGIPFHLYDPGRTRVPLRGRDLHARPQDYWDQLSEPVRAWYRRKICLYGPESTGKTTLAAALAEAYGTLWVPETARRLLEADPAFSPERLEAFAQEHARAIDETFGRCRRYLFVDTDYTTTCIYGGLYWNRSPVASPRVKAAHRYDLTLNCAVDLPWVADPQRDQGHRRAELAEAFTQALEDEGRVWRWVRGQGAARTLDARAQIDEYFSQEGRPCIPNP